MEILNKVQLIGRVGNCPKTNLKYSQSNGDGMTYFSLAINRSSAESKTVTDWFNVKAYGKIAEIIASIGEVGQLVLIEGRLQTRDKNEVEVVLRGSHALYRIINPAKKGKTE